MTQNTRSASWIEVEILKFPVGLHAIKSVALNFKDFTYTAGQRNVIPAGTILTQSTTMTDKKTKYAGSGTVAGILARPIDYLASATEGGSPGAPMLYFGCVFATQYIVDFTLYASALVHDLSHCSFE